MTPAEFKALHSAKVMAIELSRGLVALVDDADFAWLNEWKWFAVGGLRRADGSRLFYAARQVATPHGLRQFRMHNAILPCAPGFRPDHENGDGLDNRRCNLRPATPTESARNRCAWGGLGLKGVTRRGARFRASIWIGGKPIALGSYATASAAAAAYDEAARTHFGSFARLNSGATPSDVAAEVRR